MFLPLVGLIIGAIGWGGYWVASQFLSHQTSIIISIATMVLSTGALHEDGFADFCDGFGGGYGKEAILRIMKDSHIGCYGVIGLILIFGLRYSLLLNFDSTQIVTTLIIGQGASRFAPVMMVRTSKYARIESSKSAHSALGISLGGVALAAATALAPTLILGWHFTLLYMGVIALIFILFRSYLIHQIGGFTGDTLGALQIIGEISFYITLLSL